MSRTGGPLPAGKHRKSRDAAICVIAGTAAGIIITGALIVVPGARHVAASVADSAAHRHGGGSKSAFPPQVTPALRVPFAARVVAGPSPAGTGTPAVTPAPSRVRASSAIPGSPKPAPSAASPGSSAAPAPSPDSSPVSSATTSSPSPTASATSIPASPPPAS